MPLSPPLHLGWLLDYSGKGAVYLKPAGLQAHTAVIAQSGSGKSFTLGRLLEEIVSKTLARVLILDPNSDFAKFSEVRLEAWKEKHLKEYFAPRVDTLDHFRRRWAEVGFRVLTNRDPATLGLQQGKTRTSPITISWGDLTRWEQGGYLGILGPSESEEMRLLHDIHFRHNQEHGGLTAPSLSLQQFAEKAGFIIALSSVTSTSGSVIRLQPTETGGRFLGRVAELCRFQIWDNPMAPDIGCQMPHPTDRGGLRVVCLDLGSLAEPEERLLVAERALRSLWKSARDSWAGAMEKEPDKDERAPVFVVIDEAHNLGPAEPRGEPARRVNDILVRIAAEGRKFGLFLLLVTQRPSRLDQSLLSQCDNLVLMKMNNRHDIDLIERVFGFVPAGWAQRAFQFKTGNALLAGQFIEGPTYAHVAPRRTQEGGRNIRDAFWAQDPSPLQPQNPAAQPPQDTTPPQQPEDPSGGGGGSMARE
jgi:uncharacterized protein